MELEYLENQEYYENLDKRTKESKEYQEWKKNHEASSSGLGDSIQKIAEVTKIKDVVEFIAGEDCGCEERKNLLNKLFPYKKPLCLEEDEYLYLKEYFAVDRNKVTADEQIRLVDIYNRVFGYKLDYTSCRSCIRTVYIALKEYITAYE